MEVKDILTHLNLSESDLKKGDLIAESQCEYCGGTFGYILIKKDKIALAENLVPLGGYDKPEPLAEIKCLCCGEKYNHIQDLFTKIIYKKS